MYSSISDSYSCLIRIPKGLNFSYGRTEKSRKYVISLRFPFLQLIRTLFTPDGQYSDRNKREYVLKLEVQPEMSKPIQSPKLVTPIKVILGLF